MSSPRVPATAVSDVVELDVVAAGQWVSASRPRWAAAVRLLASGRCPGSMRDEGGRLRPVRATRGRADQGRTDACPQGR